MAKPPPVLDALRGPVADGVVPGAVVGVLRDGIPSVAALGSAGGTDPELLRPDAVVRLASLTKPVVAALVLGLVDDGVLALDDPVERTCPELADRRVLRRLDAPVPTETGPVADTVPADRPLTVDDLLTMRAGLGFAFEGPCPTADAAGALGLGMGPPDPGGPPAPDEFLRRLATLPLLEQPGTAWRYEMAFALLGVLAARAAGLALPELLRGRILDPLGMADTGFVAGDRLVPAWAAGDDGPAGDGGAGGGPGADPWDGVADSRWRRAPAFPDARGGLVGTAADVLALAGMLLREGVAPDGSRVLSPGAVAALTTDTLTAAQRAAPSAAMFLDGGGWGRGVGVHDPPGGPRRYGWAGGLGTLWWSYPDHGVAAVLLTQVMPPQAAVFDAFTAAVEDRLGP